MKLALIAGLLGLSVVAFVVMPTGREAPGVFPAATERPSWPGGVTNARELRRSALERATLGSADEPPHDLTANPEDPDGLLTQAIVPCRFVPAPVHGTTTKFDCVLRNGERVSVKYGHTGEIHAELAASRLLSALGFPTDRMYLVPKVRCFGCPRLPFYAMWTLESLHASHLIQQLPDDRYSDFEWVTVERRIPGVEVETTGEDGWGWYELDATRASRAEKDALRLAALFIAHWDNKAPNQRLVCARLRPFGASARQAPLLVADEACEEPVAYVQDLGATFGPHRVDLRGWARAPIWTDARACRVSMSSFPYGGGTFKDVTISDEGRQMLLARLQALTRDQVRSLFAGARFREFHGTGRSASADAWTDVFFERVRAIADAGPCPKG